MASIKKYRVLLIIISVSVLVLLFFMTRQDTTEHVGAYRCIYIEGSFQARCVSDTSPGGCYGYYDLRTSDVEDGIIIDNNISSTCEEFTAKNNVFFDENGNFLSKR